MVKEQSGSTLILLTILVSFGIFMNVLDVSIANVAIPYIAGDFGVSSSQGTWIITSFAVSQAIMLPITGWLAKQIGEVRLFVWATACFTLASMLCAVSFSYPMLLGARILQGAASGPMIPLSQTLLLAFYPAEKKGLATAIWAMVAVVAPILGPIVGGYLTYNYSWPWIFLINVPVGIIAVVGTAYLLKGQESDLDKKPIDAIGLALLICAVASLQILLDYGNEMDWFNSTIIQFLAVFSFIFFSFLIVWEWYEHQPMVNLRLFLNRNFLIGTLCLSLGYLLYFANIVIFPLWLQTQMGYTAVWAGLALAPVGVLSFFCSPIIGNNLHRWDPRWVVSFGFMVFAIVSIWNSTFTTDAGFINLIIPRFVQGLGIACFFAPLIVISVSNIPPAQFAAALGLVNFMRILSGSFGTSISVSLWEHRESLHHSQLVEHIDRFSQPTVAALEILKNRGWSELSSFAQLNNSVTSQAYMLSTNDVFWLSGVLFLFLLGVVWLAKPPFISAGAKKTVIAAE